MDLGQLTDEVFEAVIFDLMERSSFDPSGPRAWSAWESEYDSPRWTCSGTMACPRRRWYALDARAHKRQPWGASRKSRWPTFTTSWSYPERSRRWRPHGLENAIATSCTVPLAGSAIRAAQLVPPSVLVTVDDVVHGKPHPEPFLEAARRLGADPRRCLAVEDAPRGLEAARAAGCFTLAVVTTTPREALDADAIVADLSDVRFDTNHEGVRAGACQ